MVTFCFCRLGLFAFSVVGVIAKVMGNFIFLAFICSVWPLYSSDAIIAVKAGMIDNILISVHSSDMFID